jgi:lambda family phage tail tape measure protein
MSEAAGNINIVLSVNKANYTAAMTEAQRQLDTFAGKSKEAGHATVSSMQASSAAIRELRDPLGNNQRAVERFLTTIPGVGQALKLAFPLIGGLAFAGMLFDIGTKVYDFVEKVRAMPEALTVGFRALAQAQMLANDEMRLSNDRLDDQIAKLEHRPQNVIAEELDQARVNADKLADSLAKDQKAMADLMKANENGIGAELLGMGGTKGVFNAINLFNKDMASLGYQKQIAMGKGDTKLADNLDAQMKSRTEAEKQRLTGDLQWRVGTHEGSFGATEANAPGDQSSNLIAERAALAAISGRDETAKLQADQAAKETQLKKDQDAKEAATQAKEAAARAKALAAQLLEQQKKSMIDALDALKADHEISIAETLTYWSRMVSATKQGTELYKFVLAKYGEVNQESYRWQDEQLRKLDEDARKKAEALKREDGVLNRVMDEWEEADSRMAAAQAKLSETNAKNTEEMNAITRAHDLATGAITKRDAALQEAADHVANYAAQLAALQSAKDALSPADIMGGKSVELDAQIVKVTGERDRTAITDQQNINNTTAVGGAISALDEFVAASRDAAGQMRELVSNTLHGLNAQIIAGMMGQRTNFKSVGSDFFKSIANSSLTRAEGSLLSAVGLGKGPTLGTAANPMVVRMAAGAAGAAKSIGSDVASMAGGSLGKFGGFVGSMLKAVLPGLADGGYINGPAIVGEHGPELFNPSVSGHIIPNFKMSRAAGGDTLINVDATGSTDPAQTQAAVMRGIAAAAPHIIAASVSASQARNARLPSSRRN